MTSRPRALRSCLVLAVTSASWTPVFAEGNETRASVSVTARRHEQVVHDVPGVASAASEMGVFRADLWQKSQISDFSLGVAASGEGGRSNEGGVRYLGGTLTPSIAYEGPRQTHHLSLSLSKSYDSQGMARASLREQLDAASLTDDQKNRYMQAGLATDHYFSLTPRHAVLIFLSAARLDREVVTRTYVGGGFIEREMSPLWKLRLGGSTLRVIYDGEEIHASGPEAQSLHEWSEAWLLTLKAGVKDYKSDGGDSTAQNGGAALVYKRGEERATLAFDRVTGSKPVTAEVTTSDVTAAKGRVSLGSGTALEGNFEQRLERWLHGVDGGGRAESLITGMAIVIGWGGQRSPPNDRSRFNVVLSYNREDLRLKTGSRAVRQVASAGLERFF